MKYKKLTISFSVQVSPENIGLVRRLYSKDDLEIGAFAEIDYYIEAKDNSNYTDKAKAIVTLFNGSKLIDSPRL